MTAMLITVMPNKKYSIEDLKVGSLIRDKQTGDLALLVYRYDLFADIEEEDEIWIWSMTWTGPATDSYNRNVPFLEQAILGLLNGEVWELKSSETD